LRAATAPRPVRVAEEHHHRAAVLVNRWRDEVSHRNGAARRACVAAGRSSAADAFEAPKSADRRAMWNGKPDAPDRQRASAYEQKKNEHTLAVLPDEPIGRAMEMACAEGHLTERLAPRVVSLLAIDGCGQSLGRARTRCKNHANVEFQSLDLAGDAIPGGMELIVCSDALYSVKDAAELHRIAKKLASALAPGGRIVATHAFVLGDDPQRSAFDWDCPFGATTIDGVFSETPGLEKERSLVTELYRVDLYRRPIGGAPKADPEIAHVELDSPLDPEVERQIVWGGATLRRSGARISEVTERVPILMYHQVSGAGAPSRERYRVDPRAFEQQLRFLRQHGYHSISAAEFLEAIRIGEPLRGRPVMLTFDDAYRDFFDTAWPLLRRYDFGAEVFVVTEKVGGCADWDVGDGKPAPLMAWEEIEALRGMGVGFGSHLASHRTADGLSTEELLREGACSRFALEARLQGEIRAIALPFGNHNQRVIRTLRTCGYEIGFTTHDAVASIRMDPMILPRLEIMGTDDLAAFASKIGRHDALRGTRR
jgi:peptidoglycan/xylan/chitin deacetylase (PgdA/CDA1 family)